MGHADEGRKEKELAEDEAEQAKLFSAGGLTLSSLMPIKPSSG